MRLLARAAPAILLVAAGLLACSDFSPTATGVDPAFAPGGGGPPIKVTATVPDSAEQGTALTVRVLGSNFEPGAVAEFVRAGVPKGVETNATRFISPDELEADITIDDLAELGLYDVEVTTIRGKKGVGTELFRVKEMGRPVALEEISMEYTIDDLSVGLRSDGAGTYFDGVTEVWAVILDDGDFKSETGTLRLGHANGWGIDEAGDTVRVTGTVPTRIGTVGGSPYLGIETVRLRFMTPGDTGVAVVGIHFYFEDGTYTFRFGRDCPGNRVDATRATAIRHDADTWTISGELAYLCRPLPREKTGPDKDKGRPVPYPGDFPAHLPFHVTLKRKP